MKRIILFLMLSIMSKMVGAALPASTFSIAPILQNAMPAVVNIVASGKMELVSDPFLRKTLQQENPSASVESLQGMSFNKSGSGIIINANQGLIVTNAHMVSQASSIVVNLNDGRKYLARILGTDNETDIAVLQIHASKLTALRFANSNTVRVGDFVAAIGNPFGLQQTVTSGIVSGLHRSNLNIEGLEDFIQTDAPINTGNSGGALINAQGFLIGMNTAILADNGGNIGIGFAIPSNMVRAVVIQLLKYGQMNRGMLGILVQSLNPQLADALDAPNNNGAIVSQVVPLSPAAKAGIQVGDIILAINGQPVQNNGEVRATIGLMRVGDHVTLTVLRKGKPLTIVAVIAHASTTENANRITSPFLFGLTLRDTTEETTNNGYIQGVYVVHVQADSLAWSMGIKPGDIIVSANEKPVNNVKALSSIASKAKNHLLLRVINNDGAFFVLL